MIKPVNNVKHGEPYDGKLSRTVRERGGNIPRDNPALVHSLIAGGRKGALYGSIATVILAIVFTCFQGIEYSVSPFTISDGVFGTCFFFGTGFHGLIIRVGLFIYKEGFYLTTLKNIILHNVLFIEAGTSSLSGLVLKVNNKKPMVTLPIFKQEECKHCCNDPNSHVTLKKDFLE